MDFGQMLTGVNYFAVLVSIVWAIVFGLVWYTPKLMFSAWAKEMNSGEKPTSRKNPAIAMQVMLLATVIEIFSLGLIIELTGGGIVRALLITVIISVGIAAMARLSETFFEQGSMTHWVTSTGYQLISLGGAAIIMGLWQ